MNRMIEVNRTQAVATKVASNTQLVLLEEDNANEVISFEVSNKITNHDENSHLKQINESVVLNPLDILQQRNISQIVAPVNNTEFDADGNPIKPKATKRKKDIVRVDYISVKAANNVTYTKEVFLLQNPSKYEGGKYNDLPQILPYFPSNVETFIDVFGGAFTMGINVKANSYIYNDYSSHISNFIKALSTGIPEDNIQKVKDIIAQYKLESVSDKPKVYIKNSIYEKVKQNRYNKLKKVYNESKEKCPFQFYVLSIFPIMGFVKFDKNDNFTSHVGFSASFNSDLQKKFLDYSTHLTQSDNIQYFNKSFEFVYDLDLNSNDMVYCDVPYFNSKAGYNNGWSEKMDSDVLLMLNYVNNKGIKFAYSNVIEHKDKLNQKLIDWAEANDYTIHYLNKDYVRKIEFDEDGNEIIPPKTQEVLITNYTQGVNTDIEMAKTFNEDKFIIQGKALDNDELLRANEFIKLADNAKSQYESSIVDALEYKAQEIKYKIQAGSELLLFKTKCKAQGLNYTKEIEKKIDFSNRTAQYYTNVAKDKRLANLTVEQIMKIDKPSFEKLKRMVHLDDKVLDDALNGKKFKKEIKPLVNAYNDILTDDEFVELSKLKKNEAIEFFVEKLRMIASTKPSNNTSFTKDNKKIS